MVRWHGCLYEMKKDEEKRMEVEHQQLASRMIRSVEGGTGLLHKIIRPTAWRGEVQNMRGEEEEDANPLASSE